MSDELVTLADCPPGLFEFDGALGFKTEYGATIGKDVGGGEVKWTVTGWSDVYCVESGEVFWGGMVDHEAREKLLVRPVVPSSNEALLREALVDARNNILSLLGGLRDDMPDAAVKLFQAQARQIDAVLNTVDEPGTREPE